MPKVPITYFPFSIGEKVEHQLKKVSVFGDKIILGDGSQWVIAADHCSKSINWYETQRILVREVNGEVGRYQLVNVDTADIVEAQLVSGRP